ncbi:hypothetical protein JCM33774_51410 [Actinophytocola sp. KF-1]
MNRDSAARRHATGDNDADDRIAAASASSSPGPPSSWTSSPVTPSSTSSGRQPRAYPTTGVPSANDSTTAVPPGSSHRNGNTVAVARATNGSRSAGRSEPTQHTRCPSTCDATWSHQ